MTGILIETAEGPSVELYPSPAAGGLMLVTEQAVEFGPRQRIVVVLRPERVKDVVRFLVDHMAELEAALRIAAPITAPRAVRSGSCRFPGELSSCSFPACVCDIPGRAG